MRQFLCMLDRRIPGIQNTVGSIDGGDGQARMRLDELLKADEGKLVR